MCLAAYTGAQGIELVLIASAIHEGVARTGIEFATIRRPTPMTLQEVSRLIAAAPVELDTSPGLDLDCKRQTQFGKL